VEVRGVLAAGESSAAMVYIKARRGLSPRQIKLILLIFMLAGGIPVGAWATGSWQDAALAVEFAIVGLIVGTLVVQRIAGPLMRKALTDRGQSYEQQLTFRLTSEGIIYDLADLTMAARWSCVTDLYQTRKYWVFLVQSSAMVLPRRFFATRDDELKFIAQAMSQMPAAAQERSPDATRLLRT
jgi:hypothetical protein